ncbi:hypothetical protein GO730_37415 [Spirosoma sp. HMF3257]|uniref:DUF1565 domain-containing protein n=1 Tax=Spirosoma telluris TaxID=2183553 RepID=A0A327NCT8_9BACT|nr:hypothetical protein [Spirosoma telluris]RAI73071.1 hypothetical protein HMF3257_37340 [Spirosoma telluris]
MKNQYLLRLLFLLLSLAGLGSQLPLQAQTIRYVKPTATGTGSGESWPNASSDLQAMIDASGSGQQVWVAAGTYKPTSTTARTISFSMKDGVAIYGGFEGTETQLSQRPSVNPVSGNPSSSTLSGDIGTLGDASDNSYHVISNLTGLTTTAVLDGFVITGGNANGGDNNEGGGAYNRLCSPSFRNCLLQGNSATRGGGAMYNSVSSPVLTNCVLQSNTAPDGGAMFNNGRLSGIANPVLTNCVLRNNTSVSNGGAMYNDGSNSGQSSPVLTNCVLQGNSATGLGGAMYNIGANNGQSSPVLTNCSLQNNTVSFHGERCTTMDGLVAYRFRC